VSAGWWMNSSGGVGIPRRSAPDGVAAAQGELPLESLLNAVGSSRYGLRPTLAIRLGSFDCALLHGTPPDWSDSLSATAHHCLLLDRLTHGWIPSHCFTRPKRGAILCEAQRRPRFQPPAPRWRGGHHNPYRPEGDRVGCVNPGQRPGPSITASTIPDPYQALFSSRSSAQRGFA